MPFLHKFTVQVPLLFSFLLLSPLYSNSAPISKPNNNNVTALINKACSSLTNKVLCMNYLKSNPKVMAAATSKPLDFALAIIHSAIGEAKNIHSYLSKPRGKLSPPAIEAYNYCKTQWGDVASGLEWSLKIIRKDKGYALDTSTDYDFVVNLDHATNCGTTLAQAKIQDPVIEKGKEKVQLAVGGANKILEWAKPPKKND
ncbi:uncharacterized protein [Nicotiana tomentosiformis]|uniref:uncharacterized protein n=1 Tax=Nicotiana tomentosiformis TaxID=4098 RepID=UPI00388CAC45